MPGIYEISLIMRARNYASNDLRRVGADLNRLGSASRLKNESARLVSSRNALANTKTAAQAEVRSLQTGAKRAALSKVIATQNAAQVTSLSKVQKIERDIQISRAQSLESAARISRLSRLSAQAGQPTTGVTSGRAYELQRQLNAAKIRGNVISQDAIKNAKLLEDANVAQAAQAIKSQEAIKIATDANIAEQLKLADTIDATTVQIATQTKQIEALDVLAEKAASTQKFSKWASNIEHVGRAFQTLGLFATAAFAVAAHSAATFATESTLAATQMITRSTNSVAQIQRTGAAVNSQLIKFLASGQSVSSAADVQQAAYNIPSGIPSLAGNSLQKARETVTLIKEFNQVVKANFGLVDLNGVTSAGIILINTFGTSIGHLPHEFDVMQSAVNRGKVTMAEFVAGLGQTAPAAKAAGYNFDSMAGTLSFLSGKLPQYTRVAVGYARALELFQNIKLQQYMKQNGAAITDLNGKLLPYNKIIAQILKVDPALARGGNLIDFLTKAAGTKGFVQARRVITPSLQDLAGLNAATQAVPANAAGLVNASATALSKTGAVKWKELTTQIKALTIEIGNGAIPAFQKMAKPIEYIINSFNKLSPNTKHLVGDFGAFAAVAALAGGTLLVTVGMFAKLGASIRLLLLGKTGVLALQDGFVTTGMALRLGLIGALLAGVYILIKYHDQVMHVVNALGGMKRVVEIISIAFGAFKFSSFIMGLNAITKAEEAATVQATLLRGALLGIATLGVVSAVVVITYIERHQIQRAGQKLQNKVVGLQRNFPGVHALASAEASAANAPGIKQALGLFGIHGVTTQSLLEPVKGLPVTKTPAGLTSAQQKQLTNLEKQSSAVTLLTNGLKKHSEIVSKPPYKAGASILKQPPPPFTDANVLAAVRNIVKLDELAKRKPTLANFKAANAALLDLQGKANKDQLSAAQDLINALESQQSKADKKSVSDTKKAANERLQAIKDAQANVMSMYDELLQQNQSVMGQLFSGPYINSPVIQDRLQYGGQLTGTDYLKDLKSQTGQFRAFFAQIGRLQRRGAPQELVQQLIQAGPSALPAIRALSSMGKNQWNQYIKVFKDGQDLLHKQTMIQLKAQLKDYRKYGSSIALQIISGMRDKRLGLTNELKKLIEGMFGVDVPVVHAPTKTAIAAATRAAKGRIPGHPASTYTGATTHSKPIIGTHTRSTQGVTINHNYNVVAPTSEHTSIKTQLRHAEFARKSKLKVIP